jgi:hypothetical protein
MWCTEGDCAVEVWQVPQASVDISTFYPKTMRATSNVVCHILVYFSSSLPHFSSFIAAKKLTAAALQVPATEPLAAMVWTTMSPYPPIPALWRIAKAPPAATGPRAP